MNAVRLAELERFGAHRTHESLVANERGIPGGAVKSFPRLIGPGKEITFVNMRPWRSASRDGRGCCILFDAHARTMQFQKSPIPAGRIEQKVGRVLSGPGNERSNRCFRRVVGSLRLA